MLDKAALAAPSLSHRKNGSRRQVALASVQRLKAVSASPMNTQVSFHHQIFPLGMENKVRHSNWQEWIWISRKEGTQEFALPWEIPSLKLSLHKGLSSPQCRQRGKAVWIVMQRWHLITSAGFWSRKEKFMKMQMWLRSNCLPCLSATSAATGAVAKNLCTLFCSASVMTGPAHVGSREPWQS